MECNFKTIITMRKILIIISLILSISVNAQVTDLNLSSKQLMSFTYNDTLKYLQRLDLSDNYIQEIVIDSMKELIYVNICVNILDEQSILNILKVLNKNGLTLGWCYLSGGGNAYINDLKINKDYLMLLRKRWNISINTNN